MEYVLRTRSLIYKFVMCIFVVVRTLLVKIKVLDVDKWSAVTARNTGST